MESMHHPPNDPDHPCHKKEEGSASEGDVLFMKICPWLFLNHTVSFSKLALASYSTRRSACSQVSTHTHYLCSYLVWMNMTVRGQHKCTGSVSSTLNVDIQTLDWEAFVREEFVYFCRYQKKRLFYLYTIIVFVYILNSLFYLFIWFSFQF